MPELTINVALGCGRVTFLVMLAFVVQAWMFKTL